MKELNILTLNLLCNLGIYWHLGPTQRKRQILQQRENKETESKVQTVYISTSIQQVNGTTICPRSSKISWLK